MTYEAEQGVIDAALELYEGTTRLMDLSEVQAFNHAVSALLAARGPRWWVRTWADVRPGDTIKLDSGHPDYMAARVLSVMSVPRHVKEGVDGHWSDVPADFVMIHARLDYTGGDPARVFEFPSDGPVLLHLTQAEYETVARLGWSNRLTSTPDVG